MGCSKSMYCGCCQHSLGVLRFGALEPQRDRRYTSPVPPRPWRRPEKPRRPPRGRCAHRRPARSALPSRPRHFSSVGNRSGVFRTCAFRRRSSAPALKLFFLAGRMQLFSRHCGVSGNPSLVDQTGYASGASRPTLNLYSARRFPRRASTEKFSAVGP